MEPCAGVAPLQGQIGHVLGFYDYNIMSGWDRGQITVHSGVNTALQSVSRPLENNHSYINQISCYNLQSFHKNKFH